MARKYWRCFHCTAVFTSEHEAGIHFGADESATCACVLPHEQHLVEHIRDLEARLSSYREDRDKILLSVITLEVESRQAQQREEERGYARGLADSAAERRDLFDALHVMLMAWEAKTTGDALREIGLTRDFAFPCKEGTIQSYAAARDVFLRIAGPGKLAERADA